MSAYRCNGKGNGRYEGTRIDELLDHRVNEVGVREKGSGIGKQLHQGIHFSVIKRVYELVQSGLFDPIRIILGAPIV